MWLSRLWGSIIHFSLRFRLNNLLRFCFSLGIIIFNLLIVSSTFIRMVRSHSITLPTHLIFVHRDVFFIRLPASMANIYNVLFHKILLNFRLFGPFASFLLIILFFNVLNRGNFAHFHFYNIYFIFFYPSVFKLNNFIIFFLIISV
jgi:hypothetical protein